jgi:hypothetical protein
MDLLYTVTVFGYVCLSVYLPLAADCLLIGLNLYSSDHILDPTLFSALNPVLIESFRYIRFRIPILWLTYREKKVVIMMCKLEKTK